jgi:hypothetical protein
MIFRDVPRIGAGHPLLLWPLDRWNADIRPESAEGRGKFAEHLVKIAEPILCIS